MGEGKQMSTDQKDILSQDPLTDEETQELNFDPKTPVAPAGEQVSEDADISLDILSIHKELQEKVMQLSQNITSRLSTKEYSTALDSFLHLKQVMSQIADSNMQIHQTLHSSLGKTQQELETTLAVMDYESTQLLKYIEQLLHLAKSEVDAGNMDVAVSLYKKINDFYHKIPREFADKRAAAQDEIIKMYLYIKNRRDALMKDSYEKVVTDFEQLYPFAQDAIQGNNVEESKKLVAQLTELQEKLPQGYPLIRTSILSKTASMKNQVSYLEHLNILKSQTGYKDLSFSADDVDVDGDDVDPAPSKYDGVSSDPITSGDVSIVGDVNPLKPISDAEVSDISVDSQLSSDYDEPVAFSADKLQSMIDRAYDLRKRIDSIKQELPPDQ